MLIYFHCTHFPLGRFQLVIEQAHSLLAGWRSARQTVDPAVAYFSLFWPGLGLLWLLRAKTERRWVCLPRAPSSAPPCMTAISARVRPCADCVCASRRVRAGSDEESLNAVSQDFYSLIEIFARALDRARRCSSILSCVNCFHRQNTKLCNGQQNNMSGNWLYQCFLLLCVSTLVSDVLSNEAQSLLLG